jgi:hypothetical protein
MATTAVINDKNVSKFTGVSLVSADAYVLVVHPSLPVNNASDLIAYAKSLGIEFVICDHHLPGKILPEAYAILNPKQIDCTYPFKELCGCGVVFKLISALAEKYKLPAESYLEYLDLVEFPWTLIKRTPLPPSLLFVQKQLLKIIQIAHTQWRCLESSWIFVQ